MKRSAQLQKGVPHPSCGRNGSALITMVALFRTYHGSLVWGKPGYEHILVFGGLETTGVPMTELGVITLNGEIPSKLGLYLGVSLGPLAFIILICSGWRLGKRHQRRKIARRWQTAYLMVRAHLETKRLQTEAPDDEDEAVRPASQANWVAPKTASRLVARQRVNARRA